jgi:hypothetical protein
MDATFDEVWLHSPSGEALCALISGARGWLMYLREEGDSGFSSRNPAYEGDPEATIEYILSNGQRDAYPASWALPLEEVQRALDFFAKEHKQPPFITWHED